MRLSVVVPAHDAEGTIGKAIRSALDQTRPPDEVVVVDDGSTDATVDEVATFGTAVRLVVQEQRGPSAARNAGVEASTGDWIAFLDADDEWHPEKLERQLRVASDDVVMVATDWTRQLTEGPVPASLHTTALTSAEILLLNRFQTSTVLLRRRAFLAAGGFDPTLDGVEDWDMWLRASRYGKVLKIDWPFVGYTDTASGYSKALDRVYRTGKTMLERQFESPPGRDGRAVLAWHHLRFAVAYLLAGDRAAARDCLADCRRAGLAGAVPEASLRYLLPFLAQRAERRVLARRRPGRRRFGYRGLTVREAPPR